MLFKRYEHRLVEKFKSFQKTISDSFGGICLEIEELLEKNEIHLHLKNKNSERKVDPNTLKHIVLNTKQKVATIFHFDELSNQAIQSFHSLEDNKFLYQIYDIIFDLENKSSLRQTA